MHPILGPPYLQKKNNKSIALTVFLYFFQAPLRAAAPHIKSEAKDTVIYKEGFRSETCIELFFFKSSVAN